MAVDIVQRGKLELPDGHILTARWSTTEQVLFADPRTVKVSGMKDISKNILLMYFENETKSGGGIVEDIQIYDDNTAYITFESSEGIKFIKRLLNYSYLAVLFLLTYK